MNSLTIYSLSLLFIRVIFSAEEYRLAHYIGFLRKMRFDKITIQGGQVIMPL